MSDYRLLPELITTQKEPEQSSQGGGGEQDRYHYRQYALFHVILRISMKI
jgi:hypothetical protein